MAQGEGWRDTYEVVDEIGAGGIAKVYSAKHRETGQFVAVKVMRQELLQSTEERERFRREAIAIRDIDSQHVCSVYDFDTSGDEVYMVMEFVEGVMLRQVLKTLPWTVSDVSVVIGQVGEALYAAHQSGIIHRDLKPENIVLTGAGLARQVKVLDFGFAKLLEAERSKDLDELTKVGAVFGTPQYMSPEQTTGKPVTPQSDLFALGVIAYEVIAGRRPWNGSSPHEVMLAVATKPPPKLEEVRCDLEPRRDRLDEFFANALHKSVDHRFRDAHEFCHKLNQALGFEQVRAVEDPRAWFEEITNVSMFDDTALESGVIAADAGGDGEEETLRSSWHSVTTAVSDLAGDDDAPAPEDDDEDDARTILRRTPVRSGRPPIDRAPPRAPRARAGTAALPRDGVPRPSSTRARNVTVPIKRLDSKQGDHRFLYLALGLLLGAGVATIVVLLMP